MKIFALDIHSRDKSYKNGSFDVIRSRSIFDKKISSKILFNVLLIKYTFVFSSMICTLQERTKRKVSGFFCG